MKTGLLSVVLATFCVASSALGQLKKEEPEPVKLLATNNSGFVQTGTGGPDNLVLFTVTPIPDATLADIEQSLPFSVIGNLTLGDTDGNGADNSIGTFSGLEWSRGLPGQGTLVGSVLNEGAGAGEVYRIDPLTAQPTVIGAAPVDGEGNQMDFSDLAFNPVDQVMYGLMNDITDDGSGFEFGNNSIWFDSDGDLVPDTQLGSGIFANGSFMQTLASGLAFDTTGVVYVYDIVDEVVLIGFGLSSASPNSTPFVSDPPDPFEPFDIELDHPETTLGNGLTAARGQLFIATEAAQRNTFISTYELPPPRVGYFPEFPPDPVPEVFPAARFSQVFSQNQFVARVSVGDLVGAEADLSDVPPLFPDNIIINRGMPAKGSALEAIAASDDFRYCISSTRPFGGSKPVDMELVYTVPSPGTLTVLGLEIESQGLYELLQIDVSVLDHDTEEFVDVASFPLPQLADGTETIDLTASLDRFVDPVTGTVVCRLQCSATGLVVGFPWPVKLDSVLLLAE